MGKEGDLLDDSALINAFEDAISNYKISAFYIFIHVSAAFAHIMHRKKAQDSSLEGGKVIGSCGKDDPNNYTEDLASRRDADVKSNYASTAAPEVGETTNVSPLKENHYADSHRSDPLLDASNGIHIQGLQDALKGYPYPQDGDYNQLLSHYYELEEKR
ncbi:Survival motor neuron-like protein [Quillaja saponaria]|uniref:Survival motor neuron-like protein n=1 Tax=Quillaja saponaria TaxID=32244 RepID=A0AAD7P6A9_QUISA|nr:Survival motor neuron-like protein [Quillaja saponaria]